jgi:DNA-binding transcriptional ArsR family regulator
MKTVAVDPVRVFRALGHPARLRMTEELARGERCVADLAGRVVLSWSTVSRHLALLRAAGIVHGQQPGSQVLHSLALPCVGVRELTRRRSEGSEGRSAHVLQLNLNNRLR